jgi:hypothetical protein
MTEPLGHSQVLPYVEGLARAGFRMEIVAFEPRQATAEESRAVDAVLAASGWTRERMMAAGGAVRRRSGGAR